ncbi:MAG: hypothetical protein Q4E45_02385 [Eubacteriales bacterium]|nr:hypothetical protein [Eubacteriales bacterium]
MGEIIPFPIQIKPTDYWLVYDSWALNGYWKTCEDCRRSECFHAGCWFIACTHHSKNTGGDAALIRGAR